MVEIWGRARLYLSCNYSSSHAERVDSPPSMVVALRFTPANSVNPPQTLFYQTKMFYSFFCPIVSRFTRFPHVGGSECHVPSDDTFR